MKKNLPLLSFLTVLLLAGCKKNDAPSHLDLQLNKNELTLSLPLSKDFTLTVASPAQYVGDSRMVWVSEDNSIAIVDSKTGTITAIAPGETVIYGYINGLNAVRGQCRLTVDGSINTTLATDADSYLLNAGDTLNMSYSYTPDVENVWQLRIVQSDTVGNKIVSQVPVFDQDNNEAKGKLSFVGLRPGEVKITLINKYDSKVNKTVNVKVEQVPITSFEFINENTTVPLDKPISFEAQILPQAAAYRQVFYRSSDEAIFTVNQMGVLIPKSKGIATVFASTSDGKTISRQITITDAVNVKSIQFSSSLYDISVTASAKSAGVIEVSTSPAGAAPIECIIDPTYAPKNDNVSQIELVKASVDGTRWYVNAPYGATGNGSARLVASNGTKDATGKLIADTCIVEVRRIDESAIYLKASYDALDFGSKTVVSAFINNYTTQLTEFKKATLYIEKGTVVAPKDTLKADRIVETINPNTSAGLNMVAKAVFAPVESVSAHIVGYVVKFEFEAAGKVYQIKRKVVLGNGTSYVLAK